MKTTIRARLSTLFLAGCVLPVAGATLALAAPSASASVCSGWKYASWGSGASCVSDSRLSITAYNRDDKTDGYCVELAVEVRNASWRTGGGYSYPGSTNCKNGVIKVIEGYAPKYAIENGYKYMCRTMVARGSYDLGDLGLISLWREGAC